MTGQVCIYQPRKPSAAAAELCSLHIKITSPLESMNDEQKRNKGKMSLETSFARFKYLPPELREQVWRHALSEWSVWAPTHAHFNLSVKPIITMEPLGRGAYEVGRVCRESRELMRRIYVGLKPGKGRGEPSGDYWLHPERTILYLGCSSRATDFIEILHAHERLNVAHVVLRVCQDWVEVSRFVYILARNCPDVKTLVLHSIDHKRNASKVCWCEKPDPGLADLYKTVVSHGSGSEMPYEESPDGSRFRLSFSEFFGECESEDEDEDEETPGGEDIKRDDSSFPNLHFLPPEVTLL